MATQAVSTDAKPTTPTIAFGSRSAAMWLLPFCLLAEAAIIVYVMASIGFVPPLLVFVLVFVLVGVLAVIRPRAWVFMTGAVLSLALIAANFPFIIDGPIHPVATSHAWNDINALVIGLVGIVAGVAAFVELRRGRALTPVLSSPAGEALVILVAGVLVGTTYTSVMGFNEVQASPGAGVANGVQTTPTQAPLAINAAGSSFSQKALQLGTGSGTIYVVNKDAGPHTFDIDVSGRHLSYPLRGNSTTAVVLDLPTAGTYTYYCAISGHRSSGMEGSLTVR